ncbi:Ribosomal protein L32p, partial [Ostreococcus tauri]
ADTAQAQAGGIAGEDAARERERARERARASRDDANGGDARIGGMWMLDGGVGSAMVEMWMMAVPKRKVTPSRRKKRNQFKRLPFVESVVRCAGCGKVNLPHVRCCDVEREDARRGGRGDGDAP